MKHGLLLLAKTILKYLNKDSIKKASKRRTLVGQISAFNPLPASKSGSRATQEQLPNKSVAITIFSVVLVFTLPISHAIEVEFSLDESVEASSVDDAFGFEEEGESPEIPLRGKVSFDLGYQIGDPDRWMTLGPFGQLILDWQTESGLFYSELTARNNNAFEVEKDKSNVINRYRFDPVLREAYWKKAFGDYTLTIGKSIVTWGKADLSQVIDVISPIDNSGFLFAKPEEIKTGQNVIKLDRYQGNQEYNLIFVPQASFNIETENGHPYNLSPALQNKQQDLASEWGIRWNQTRDKWELAIIAAHIHQRDAFSVAGEKTFLKHRVLGAGYTASLDPVLLKIEAYYSPDQPMQSNDFSSVKRKDYLKGMVGFDYNHNDYGSFLFEYFGEKPISKDENLLGGEGREVYALAWSDTFINDDLIANVAVMSMTNINDHLIRGGVDYKLDDSWSISSQLTIINAGGGNVFLKPLANFDRFDISLNYYFDLAN